MMDNEIAKSYMMGDITKTDYYDLCIKCEILTCLIGINEVLESISNNI